nr:MAG TPA: hypothetical protein [Caudoviricetes sp.]
MQSFGKGHKAMHVPNLSQLDRYFLEQFIMQR